MATFNCKTPELNPVIIDHDLDLRFESDSESEEPVNWTTINSFTEIPIPPNSIVLFDIDDTLIHHPCLSQTYRQYLHSYFTLENMIDTGLNDAGLVLQITEDYINQLEQTIPYAHTDLDGFNQLIKNKNVSKIVFITARSGNFKIRTMQQLCEAGIPDDLLQTVPIHFSFTMSKGAYINKYINLDSYDHVIFIDDQEHNLNSVFAQLKHISKSLYQFDHVKTMDYYPRPKLE